MEEREFCPNCGIGISNREAEFGVCHNCKASWQTEVSEVKCDLCSHKWVAVRPAIGLVKLECPNCSNMVHFENIS